MRTSLLLVIVLALAACHPEQPASKRTPVPYSTLIHFPGTLPGTPTSALPSYKVAAFYYPWYGTPQIDGKWIHWTQNAHRPPDDIASDYYPALGPYSSDDPAVVAQHMLWLRQAGVGVIIVSWWGQGSLDERPVSLIVHTAEKYGIKVAFHIEPYSTRSADHLITDIQYLYERYGSSPAFFRSNAATPYSPGSSAKGMFFVWCVKYAGSCGQGPKVDAVYWQHALDEIHALPGGALVIGNITDASWVDGGHFDGLYNYSTLNLQPHGFDWARSLPPGSLYVPSVIPGFSAHRVGYPADKFVDRDDGQTYNQQWEAALGTGVTPALVTITSFNEWHEGSMIEPIATGHDDGQGYNYADFGSMSPDGYLSLTRQWVDKLLKTQP